MNLTSMNGERRMRLTERYMDPPGNAMPQNGLSGNPARLIDPFAEVRQPDIANDRLELSSSWEQ
jgi:arsenite oxidase large subunit